MKFGNFDIAGEMESRTGADTLRAIGRAAEEIGAEPYLVGGLVRDIVAGFPQSGSPDVDIALVGVGGDGFDEIARRVDGEIVKRSQFGTVAMRVGGYDFDLVMARAESYPSPGSLPIVRPGTLEEDLARRDFSVNAMAVSLSEDNWGDLFDPEGGLADLKNGILRMLHPGSFRDDATRILRAARYSSRLSLRLSCGTRQALSSSVGFLSSISYARVRDELQRMFLESDATAALGLMQEWGVLAAIHPALEFDVVSWSAYSEEAGMLADKERIPVAYSIFGNGMSSEEATGVAARLRPGALGRRALEESAALSELISTVGVVGLSNSGLAELLDPLLEYSVLGSSLAARGSSTGARLDEYLRSHRNVQAELSGSDIIALGATEGPEVGSLLRRLRAARQDGLVRSRQEEEAFVLDGLKAPCTY